MQHHRHVIAAQPQVLLGGFGPRTPARQDLGPAPPPRRRKRALRLMRCLAEGGWTDHET